ncbi:MAG: hypothetical protein IPK84_04975 [Candidatus Moraniibacteriota bacterium]|nr:MAG: hypothetical protein IPK84_04975 [Candidatus Moranbacteria bacterium]
METEKKEKTQSRWFFGVFFFLVTLSIFATFYRVFIAKDYLVDIEVSCSPERAACFARDICDTDDESCGEDDIPIETSYYKIVERKAYNFPETCASGTLDSPECADLSCRLGEIDCTETYCSDETVPEGETCVGPGFVLEDSEGATLPNDSMGEGGEDSEDGAAGSGTGSEISPEAGMDEEGGAVQMN